MNKAELVYSTSSGSPMFGVNIDAFG